MSIIDEELAKAFLDDLDLSEAIWQTICEATEITDGAAEILSKREDQLFHFPAIRAILFSAV